MTTLLFASSVAASSTPRRIHTSITLCANLPDHVGINGLLLTVLTCHFDAEGGSALELLLGPDGEYIREIIIDELAKGIDAGWRSSLDGLIGSTRSRLLRAFGVSSAAFCSAQTPAQQRFMFPHTAFVLCIAAIHVSSDCFVLGVAMFTCT